MAIQVDDIRFQYSGGAANVLPEGNLGGAISTTRVVSQTGSLVSNNISGITILAANNCVAGNGSISYNPENGYLSFQPPGGAYVYNTVLSVTGTYSVGGTEGILLVAVSAPSLPSIYKADTVVVNNQLDKVFPTVSAAMSLVGATQYRCLYIQNIHASLSATGLVLYIIDQTNGPDTIYLGLDPAGVGDGTTTGVAAVIADGDTAPVGVTFTEPLSWGTGLQVGTLTPGQSFAFWEKRVVLPNSIGLLEFNTFKLGVALTSV